MSETPTRHDSLPPLPEDKRDELLNRDPQRRVLTPREWEQLRRQQQPPERYTLT